MSDRCLRCGQKIYGRKGQSFCSARCRYKYYHTSDLVLTIKKEWFDMILSGTKTEEYREIKPYWEKRFGNYFGQFYDCRFSPPPVVWGKEKKDIIFKNGYQKNARQFTAECSIREDTGKEEWGAEKDKRYYVLTIHRIISKENR